VDRALAAGTDKRMLSAMINPGQAGALALDNDNRTLAVLREVIGEAINPGQLWVLPLDQHRRPEGSLIVIAGVPSTPLLPDLHRHMIRVGDRARGAASAVYLLERTGAPGIMLPDLVWSEAITRTAGVSRIPVHSIHLCHPGGFSVLRSIR